MMQAKPLTFRQGEILRFASIDIPVLRSQGVLWSGGERIRRKTWEAIRRYFRRDGYYGSGNKYELTPTGKRKATACYAALPDDPPLPPELKLQRCKSCGRVINEGTKQ